MNIYVKSLLWSVLPIIMTSCSGGIDGTGGTATARVTSVGVMNSKTNSVVVNDTHFSTLDSEVIIDDEISTAADLADGQVVIINGFVDDNGENGIAERITFNTRVQGPVSQITQDPRTITVLGQTIVLHEDIIFGGTATQFSDLQVGDTLQVSGFVLANNDLSATRIDRIDDNQYEVRGPISRLDEL